MADDTNPQDQGQTSQGQTSGNGQTAKPGGENGKTDLSTLPDDVQKMIRDLRDEAKGYRTERDEVKRSLETMTTERDEAQAANRDLSEEAGKATRALTLRSLRDEFGLDDKAEKFLTATDDEELREQAEALAAFRSPSNDDGAKNGQGDNGGGSNSSGARHVDPAQGGQGRVDEDAERADAFFGGIH